MSRSPTHLLWGTLTRKERWGPSWRGVLVIVLLAILTGWLFVINVYPFFAVTQRVDSRVLVVEGWVHDYADRVAVNEFKSGPYERIYTTGGPTEGIGEYINDYSTAANIGGARLKAAGMPAELIQMVPSRVKDRDRTYSAAVALSDWFHANHVAVQSINLVTADVHARRTRLLFQKALGVEVKVGIIAVPNPDYDATHWWRYSEGVRAVFSECIGYIYAKFFFYPSRPASIEAKKPPVATHS